MTVRTLSQAESADFAAWRMLALRRMPYLASTLFKIVPLFNDEIPTIAVDKRWRMYVNFAFARSHTPDFVGQVLCHEAGHLLGSHAKFAEEAGVSPENHILWNIAGDCAINDDLRDAGMKELADFGQLPSKIGCADFQTPQVYFAHLLKQQDQQDDGDSTGGKGGDNGEDPGCGSGAGGKPVQGELGGEDTAEGDTNGESAGISEIEAEVARIATAQAIKDHVASHPGSIPGGFTELADQIMKPSPIPWQHLLSAKCRRLVAFKRGRTSQSYKRVNRRMHDVQLTRPDGSRLGKVIFPGTVSPKVEIAYVRDTSGSVDLGQLSQMNTEVDQIAQKMGIRGNDLLVIDVDTKVQAVTGYKGRSSVSEVHGRGGTDMTAAIEYVWDLKHKPAVVIVATDGETGWPSESGPVPVIALIITEDGERPRYMPEPPEWITTIYASVNR